MPTPDSAAFSTANLQPTFSADDLLVGLLEVSHTCILLLKPVWAENATLVDFEFVLLNTMAQQMLQLPAQPTGTQLGLYPQSRLNGVFDFYCRTFLTQQPGKHHLDYQINTTTPFYLSARRAGEGLLVSFSNSVTYSSTSIEEALRASQARERAALADAETQRSHLERLFMEAPAMITILEGPNHIFKLVNPLYQQLVGPRALLGKPIAHAMPELQGQPIFDLLDKVYQTGEPFHATEMLVQLDHGNSGTLGHNYYNFIYQPTHNHKGDIDGIQVFAYEVTAQVVARLRIEASEQQQRVLNEELAAANEELQAANEEIRSNNDALFSAQLALRRLNQELESRVQHRTRELQAAQAEAERQRARLERLFMQAPGAICILNGPELVYELVNPAYQRFFPGRRLLGLPISEAIPELTQQSVWQILQRVYQTGEPYEGNEWLIRAARTDDGPMEDIYFNFVYQARHGADGTIDGIMTFAYEVTEQVVARNQIDEANRELSTTNQQLTRINQDLDNFVYTASHDLKQPVNNMAGIFEELKRTATFHDPDAPLLLGMFESALTQIHSTVGGLAEIVQVERYHGQLFTDTVQLLPLTQAIIQSMHHQVAASGAVFALEFDEVPTLDFAQLSLQSILYNLLSNALKYAHPDRPPLIRVATERTPEGMPILVVQDNGLGMDLARYGADLFQMFRRFHDHVHGTGVGLYLVNRLVEQAGGRIVVESTVGEGTTFRVYLAGK
ncbi:PAS domain-containing protein [Hymenobacter sp. NBH84]|uniref:PAS domain-containing sensor histidine kinase n=1 Tax=Hymenobacter sp. NBH84 TaxID=2596915 RepID=UPI001624A705|nr:ATP-binding protein [Hymenobacter sp. NBH84]QNE39893.1 PAS domain-containing protein [Hymenobacter sp. NBH84]